MATLAVAGIPMLQARNDGATVATQNLIRELDLGLFFSDMGELAAQLGDQAEMTRLRRNVWEKRETFSFDAHADRLIQFFREVIAGRK